jgi:hypothetical protein
MIHVKTYEITVELPNAYIDVPRGVCRRAVRCQILPGQIDPGRGDPGTGMKWRNTSPSLKTISPNLDL